MLCREQHPGINIKRNWMPTARVSYSPAFCRLAEGLPRDTYLHILFTWSHEGRWGMVVREESCRPLQWMEWGSFPGSSTRVQLGSISEPVYQVALLGTAHSYPPCSHGLMLQYWGCYWWLLATCSSRFYVCLLAGLFCFFFSMKNWVPELPGVGFKVFLSSSVSFLMKWTPFKRALINFLMN